jgi:DivIVA domain-containing protein
MVMSPSRVDTTSPASIAAADFTTHRRGFDRDEVRALLEQVAAQIQRVQDDNARLADDLAALKSNGAAPLDEATVADLLGEEAARVLSTARDAAAQMRAKAEEGVARLLREAQDDAARLREEAALESHRQRQDAAADVEAQIEAAKHEGRQMVAEARAVRERMLSDLARRRDAARAQLARLRADRDRLVDAFEEAGRSVDEVLGDLRDAAPEPVEVETVEEAVAAVAAQAEPEPVAEQAEQAEPEPEQAEPEPEPAESAAPESAEPSPPEAAILADSASLADTSEEPAVAVAIHLGEEPATALSYAGELDTEPDRRTSVDDLFAKLRAGGPAEVVASAAAEIEQVDDADQPVDEEPTDPDEVFLAERVIAIAPLCSSIARHLKRALTDEQNEVLDALRRAKLPDDLDALVGAEADHAEHYRVALGSDLRAATAAGARSVGESRDVPSSDVQDGVLAEVTAEFVVPLRERLGKALEDADGDAVEAGATLRAAYREWRTQRADEIAAHLVLVAHGRGAYDVVEPGTPIHWVVDPDGPLCPDADDNALGGNVSAGQEFPTGHCHAPAHLGCRCGIAITQG